MEILHNLFQKGCEYSIHDLIMGGREWRLSPCHKAIPKSLNFLVYMLHGSPKRILVAIFADCYVIKFRPTGIVLHSYFSACTNCIISVYFSFNALSVAAVVKALLCIMQNLFEANYINLYWSVLFLHCFPFFFFSTQYHPGEDISERNWSTQWCGTSYAWTS